jgi:hypothetical protein
MNTNRHEYRRPKNLKSQIVTLDSRKHSPMSVILSEAKPQRAARRVTANLSRSRASKKVTVVRWVTAPRGTLTGSFGVQGIALAPSETVQWSWTHTTNGSCVSGYAIDPRRAPHPVILSQAKNLSRTGSPKKRQRPFASLRVTTRRSGGTT